MHCHPNDLIGRPYPASPTENGWHEHAQAAVAELRRYDLPASFVGTPRPVTALQRELAKIHANRDSAAYRQIIAAVPGLLSESRALIESSKSDAERSEAYVVYGITCKAAHTSGYGLGHPDLIDMATSGAD